MEDQTNDYAQFLEEVFGMSFYQNDNGFCTYCVYNLGSDNVLAIKDVFIKPGKRGLNLSLTMVDEMFTLGKTLGCNLSTVIVSKAAKEEVQQRTDKLCKKKNFVKYNEDAFYHYYKRNI